MSKGAQVSALFFLLLTSWQEILLNLL